MKNTKKLVALLLVLALTLVSVVAVLAACGDNHECKDKCETCGKCTSDCEEPECADKCEYEGNHPGNTPDPVVTVTTGEVKVEGLRSGSNYQAKVKVTVTDGVITAIEALDLDDGYIWSSRSNAYGDKDSVQAWVDEAIVGKTAEEVLAWEVDIAATGDKALIDGEKFNIVDGDKTTKATETGARVIAAIQNALGNALANVVIANGSVTVDGLRNGTNYQAKVKVTVVDGVITAVTALDLDAGYVWSSRSNAYGDKESVQAWLDEAIVGKTAEAVLAMEVDVTATGDKALVNGEKFNIVDGDKTTKATETGARVIAAIQNALGKETTNVYMGSVTVDGLRNGTNYQAKVKVTVVGNVITAVAALDLDDGYVWSSRDNAYGDKDSVQAWVNEAIVGKTVEAVLAMEVDVTKTGAGALVNGETFNIVGEDKTTKATETGARVIAAIQNALGKNVTNVVIGEAKIDELRSGTNYQAKVKVTVVDGKIASVTALDLDDGYVWSSRDNAYGDKDSVQAWLDATFVGKTVSAVMAMEVDITKTGAGALVNGETFNIVGEDKTTKATETGARVIAAIQNALGKLA